MSAGYGGADRVRAARSWIVPKTIILTPGQWEAAASMPPIVLLKPGAGRWWRLSLFSLVLAANGGRLQEGTNGGYSLFYADDAGGSLEDASPRLVQSNAPNGNDGPSASLIAPRADGNAQFPLDMVENRAIGFFVPDGTFTIPHDTNPARLVLSFLAQNLPLR